MMTAQGPFTNNQSLSYQPLKDLLLKVKQERPHSLVLMGPFIDCQNKPIDDCELIIETENVKLYKTYEDLFTDLMNTISFELQDIDKLELILAPSQFDIHHFCPIP